MVVRSPEPCRDGQYPTLCVCHVFYAGPSMDRNTQLYAQYHAMCVLFQNPDAIGGVPLQVCGSTRTLNGQEQPNNMSCLCAFQSPYVMSPVQPQVCVYLPSLLMDGGHSIICRVCVLPRAPT
jgi:hypothetical protein